MNVKPCYALDSALDSDFLIHLFESGTRATLCGLWVLGQGLDGGRRVVTCSSCRALKPKILGGR